MFLFADDITVRSLSGWIGVIVQGGAIAILGYHLLIGLPKMLREQREDEAKSRREQREADAKARAASDKIQADAYSRMVDAFQTQIEKERETSDVRAKLMITELSALRQSIPEAVVPRLREMQVELQKQSEAIEHTNEILGDWPSDPNKICQAMQTLKESKPWIIELLKQAGYRTEAEIGAFIAREMERHQKHKKPNQPKPEE